MRLPVILYLLIITNGILPLKVSNFNEPLQLTDLFLENLKADPLLLDDHEISEKSKRFMDSKIEKFVKLVSQSQKAEFSRIKRSLDDRERSISNFSIDITSKKTIPAEYSDDIRIFQHGSEWFAVSIENKTKVKIFQYKNNIFKETLNRDINYLTNLAVLSTEEGYPLIVIGENKKTMVFQYIPAENDLRNIQQLTVESPQHVAMWEQDGKPYLSIADNLDSELAGSQDKPCKITIYNWLGRHFDLIQEIDLVNIKKSVPFSIHGSHFLALVKYKPHYDDENKSYSAILKFDLHAKEFKLYQRVLTNGCTDIKYFTSELHGERFHFLVVVHSTESNKNGSISVIYKYEDQYFIPFQSIETDAVEWQPIQDLQGHAALIAITENGLKGFQYDGWHFLESTIFDDRALPLKFEGIAALHTYEFGGDQVLVMACAHCKNTTNIFKVFFSNVDTMKELHSQILSWCKTSLSDLESDAQGSDFVAESLRGDLNEQISVEEDQKRQLSAALSEINDILINLEDMTDSSLQSKNDHVFNSDIEAERVIFNDKVTFRSLRTDSINDNNIDNLIDNVLDISSGFTLNDSREFNVVVSEKPLTPKIINNVPVRRYMFVNDDATFSNLMVNGTITFDNGVNVANALNNVQVNPKNLLLQRSDQEFWGDLNVDDVVVHNLTAAKYLFGTILNEKELQININEVAVNPSVLNSQKSPLISHIKVLRVKKLDIGGLLNNVSIPALEERALKKSGDQILEETFYIDALNVDRLDVAGKLSGKQVPDDFVMANGGEYTVNQDVNFLKGLKVNKLEVLHSLNNISVTNEGELDILLIDSPEIQSIPAKKSFDNLILTNPIKLRNKINNAQMDRINPVLIDNESHDLDGDVTIEGLTEVRLLRANDLKAQEGERSFREVVEKGLKLSDTEIPVHLKFTQPVDLDDTIADRVNFLNPHDWLLQTSDSPQIVNGQKTFSDDLHLKGPVNVFRLNDVDVQKLQKDVLRLDGDQEVEGVLEVSVLVTEKGITSNNIVFDKMSAFQDETVAEFSVINSNLKVNVTKVKELKVKGLLNALKISETVRDVVRKDADFKVFGQKKFEELHVDDLIVREGDVDLIRLLKDVTNSQVTLNKSIDLNNDLYVENINFVTGLNSITSKDFKNMMDLKSVKDGMTVELDREYDQITILGDVFISDNSINGRNLTSIESDTVKADEDYRFDNVNFGEAIFAQGSIRLEGNVDNLDLNNIVEQNSDRLTEIKNKVFSETAFIDGTLNVRSTLNGIDLRRICEFSRPTAKKKILKIEGDVIFVKGPKILNINGLSVAHLMENLWFVDKAANISGTVRLQNTTFYSSVTVKEFVDETNLNLLSQNYLSKSKDQAVSAVLAFENVAFTNISTPNLALNGPINGINFNDLLKTMLLQDVAQIFESPAYFEEVRVKGLDEDAGYFVNDLNLGSDVMLYGVVNTVTGRKTVNNLSAEKIKVNHNVKIQDVDVLEWLSNAILTNGTFGVTGKKILRDAIFKRGLSLRGNLMDQEFNEKTILLVDTPQNITGRKNFISSNQHVGKFKILKIKGLVNGIELESFLQNQSRKSQDSILNSKIVLNNSVVVKNINIDVTYNDVNVTELLHNITKLEALERFQEKYENLLDMSLSIENSVKDQAYFFKYFKEVMLLDNVYDAFGLKCTDDVFRLLTFSFVNGTNTFKTFEWNIYKREFIYSGRNVESYSRPSFMEQISIGGQDYLYMEHPYGETSSGQLLRLLNSTTFEPVAQFERNATGSLISFVPPGLNQLCLGFIDLEMSGMEILCDESGSHSYYWFQTIHMENLYKATTLHTPDSLYLFLARQGLPFKDPSIVVWESFIGSPEFREKQTISEGANLNGLTAAVIGNVPHVAFSFGRREATVDSGRISIRRLDPSTQQFVHRQHVTLTAPLGAHFVMVDSLEPLLLAPTADASSPLQTLRYDGSAGFKKSLKGAALPPKSRIRIIEGGKFLVALQDERSSGVILGAVIKGPLKV